MKRKQILMLNSIVLLSLSVVIFIMLCCPNAVVLNFGNGSNVVFSYYPAYATIPYNYANFFPMYIFSNYCLLIILNILYFIFKNNKLLIANFSIISLTFILTLIEFYYLISTLWIFISVLIIIQFLLCLSFLIYSLKNPAKP